MTTFAIFALGLVVTTITAVGGVMIGLQEAADPEQSRPQDLTQIEREIVDRPDVD
jgi:hypothetical protein